MNKVARQIYNKSILWGLKSYTPALKCPTFVNITPCCRNYALKSSVNIKWVRPVPIPTHLPEKSGDMEPVIRYDKSELPLDLRNLTILNDLDEKVQRLFTLEYQRRKIETEIYRKELCDRVRRHPYDERSLEVIIAKVTACVRVLQDHNRLHPRDTKDRVFLQEVIDKRNKLLRKLRKLDYKRFEWILEKLNIVFHPLPKLSERVERKKSLRRLTKLHCESIKEARLGEYKKELDKKKVPFYEEKIAKLKWIREQELKYNLEPTVTEVDISECVKKLEKLRLEEKEFDEKVYIRKIHPYTFELYEPDSVPQIESK